MGAVLVERASASHTGQLRLFDPSRGTKGGTACTYVPRCYIATTTAMGIEPDWVKAIAFAWFARQTRDGRPGNLAAATGVAAVRMLGTIYPA